MVASAVTVEPAEQLHMGRFMLDLRRERLMCDGLPVPLRPKPFALLRHFSIHPGRVLTKQALLDALWPGVLVTDDSLVQCVGELRAAFGDAGQQLIKTVPRRGYLFEPPVTDPVPEPVAVAADPVAGRRARRFGAWWAKVAGAALALAALCALLLPAAPHRRTDDEMARRRSIAVMPFDALGEPAAGYFAAGVTTDLVTDLARLPDTLVVASAKGVEAAGGDVRRVGQQFGVRHVLTGSAWREGQSVVITARLAAVGTGAVIWSERFEYPDATDRVWRRDMTRHIASALEVRVLDSQARVHVDSEPADVVDALMKGEYILRRMTSRADVLRARALFEDALRRDPDTAAGWTWLALSHTTEVLRRWTDDRDGQLAAARHAVDQALAIDPNNPSVHLARAELLLTRGEFDLAQDAYDQVLTLNPSEARAHVMLAQLKLWRGHPEAVAQHIAMALQLNPMEPILTARCHYVVGQAEFNQGRDDAAYEQLRRTLEIDPQHTFAHFFMAAIDAHRGRGGDAANHLAQAQRVLPGQNIERWRSGVVSKSPVYLKGLERLFDGLRLAGFPER